MSERSKKSLTDRETIILHCALLTTAAVKQPFRARDVLFYIDLVKHLFHNSISENFLNLQTIQVLRILDQYTRLKWACKLSVDKKPAYRLLGKGCAHMLKVLSEPGYLLGVGDALFIQSYLNSYSSILRDLAASFATDTENALIQSSLQPNVLLAGQKNLLDLQIRELEHRIRESKKLTDFIAEAKEQETSHITSSLPSHYSYMVSYRKSFKTFLEEMPEIIRGFEFKQGFAERREAFYKPYLSYLCETRGLYERILAGTWISGASDGLKKD